MAVPMPTPIPTPTPTLPSAAPMPAPIATPSASQTPTFITGRELLCVVIEMFFAPRTLPENRPGPCPPRQ